MENYRRVLNPDRIHLTPPLNIFELENKTPKPEHTFFRKYLLPTARNIRPRIAVSVGAGRGIDEAELVNKVPELRVLGIEIHRPSIDSSFLGRQNYINGASATDTKLSPNQAGLVLMKDVLIFLPPEIRRQAFAEYRRTLSRGGVLLIRSQLGDALRVHYQRIGLDGKYIPTFPLKETENSNRNWRALLAAIQRDPNNEVSYIEYKATLEDIVPEVEEAGLRVTIAETFDHSHPLSMESRWYSYKSFVIKAVKDN